MSTTPEHFKGKDALGHVIEAQAQGIIAAAEVHGMEIPGHLQAAGDACRDSAVILALASILLASPSLQPLILLAVALLLWKVGRSAWLGWFRLERLHRVMEQERWEIEHHRQQERDELRELYAAKGFEGKLLEDVLDVLMADNDRLLKVMLEEELGLTLASYEHPLKQGVGAAVGVLLSAVVCIGGMALWPAYGLIVGALIVIAVSAGLTAKGAQNDVIPAVVWNLGLALVSLGTLYFLTI